MCGYMFPWTIWRVPYLSSNQNLLQMQDYTHVLMQIITGSPPYVPYNAPMPHACKQVLNPCPIEAMHIVVFLLALRQSLSTHRGPYHMEAPLVCTIHEGASAHRARAPRAEADASLTGEMHTFFRQVFCEMLQ